MFDSVPHVIRDFLCGYFANLIGPGSLAHAPVVTSLASTFPLGAFWYSVCAGLRPDNELLQAYNCLGRRLIRDSSMFEPFLGVPRCDLSLDELEVFMRADNPNVAFRRASRSFLSVELWPRVVAFLNWHPGGSGSQMGLFGSEARVADSPEVRDAIRNMERALDSLFRAVGEPNLARRRGRRG
jgi:hypothetical protein